MSVHNGASSRKTSAGLILLSSLFLERGSHLRRRQEKLRSIARQTKGTICRTDVECHPGHLNTNCWCRLLVLAAVVSAIGGVLADEPVRAEQGSVAPSGKFLPAPKPSEGSPRFETAREAEDALMKALNVVRESDEAFSIGQVRFDKRKRCVTIPATVNMRDGIVEYALVGEAGKRHEAIFVTQAMPEQVHLACLMLGIEQRGPSSWPNYPMTKEEDQSVRVEVVWAKHGPEARYLLENLVSDKEAGDLESTGGMTENPPWFYNGSMLGVHGLVAQSEHSFIALIADSGALVNDLRLNGRQDDHFYPVTRVLPKVGTPVTIILTFAQRPS